MAPPPQQVRIKRKKDEEPVDSLYVQTEQAHKRRCFTDFIFRRVRDEGTQREDENRGQPSLPSSSNGRRKILRAVSTQPRTEVPSIQTTSPGDELRDGINGFGRVGTHHEQEDRSAIEQSTTLESRDFEKLQNHPSMGKATAAGRPLLVSNPRRFHLTKSKSTPFPQGPAGIQKRKKGAKSDIAVFIERESRLKKPRSLLDLLDVKSSGQRTDLVEQKETIPALDQDIITPPRKRPNANATEKQWRTQQWSRVTSVGGTTNPSNKTGASIDTNSSLWDYNSLQLAEQLQEIARQESSGQTSSPTSPSNGTTTKLKVKPKVPALRYVERHPEAFNVPKPADSMDLSSDTGDDSDYVYDTYIRQPGDSFVVGTDLNMGIAESRDVLQGNVGLLVITEEDQEQWEALADDSDSEKDWNSEEEDENAEDYYGNDYPEDEVDSDDEVGKGAYNYRRRGSDDEEYDSEEAAWSEDDAELKDPWKLGLSKIGARSPETTNGVDYSMS